MDDRKREIARRDRNLGWSDKRNRVGMLEFPGGIPLIVNMMREDIISMQILLRLRLLKGVKMMI